MDNSDIIFRLEEALTLMEKLMESYPKDKSLYRVLNVVSLHVMSVKYSLESGVDNECKRI